SYDVISSRNFFSETGEIPDPLRDTSSPEQNPDGLPVPSQLPLGLIGTLVHSNQERSLAAIEIKSKNKTVTFSTGSVITDGTQNYAKVVEVERHKVIIRNQQNGRLEYLEMKQDSKLSFGAASDKGSSGEIEKVNDTTYALNRTVLNKYISDLPNLLMQCSSRAMNDPVTGEMNGFKILGCRGDSDFLKLGIQPNDVILGANGVKVDSPAKAMELFQALKGSPNVTIDVNRNGELIQLKFNIN
nr:general secretion pathway protein GspC [Pseudobdellovibrionaceae bacterium]